MPSKRVLSVSQLNAYIKGVFEDEIILHNVTVSGESEEFRITQGITHFTLREGDCRIPCVLFSVYAPIPAGTVIEAEGGVRFYPKTGKVSFIVKTLRCKNIEGEKRAAYLKLKDKLEREGVFARKKTPPARITSIAVVTGETGAVIHDFISVLRGAEIFADIKILPVRVQGAESAAQIVQAAQLINRLNCCDAAVFMRGGGAADLEAFNDETLARAVAACRVYTVSAVGHETDTTLCDLAADARAGTPSIAAQMLAGQITQTFAAVRSLGETLVFHAEKLYNKKNALLSMHTHALDRFIEVKAAAGVEKVRFLSRMAEKSVDALYLKKLSQVSTAAQQAETAALQKLETSQNRLETASYKLDAQSPLKTLSKGYARLQKNGKSVETAKQLNKGDTVGIYLIDGRADATVIKVEKTTRK